MIDHRDAGLVCAALHNGRRPFAAHRTSPALALHIYTAAPGMQHTDVLVPEAGVTSTCTSEGYPANPNTDNRLIMAWSSSANVRLPGPTPNARRSRCAARLARNTGSVARVLKLAAIHLRTVTLLVALF